MANPEKVAAHKKLCDDMNALYERKNHDYGDSFHKTYVEWKENFRSSFGTDKGGLIMATLRLEDKFNRIKTLAFKKAEVNDESVIDTLTDAANYCLMTVLELQIERDEQHSEYLRGLREAYGTDTMRNPCNGHTED